LKIIKGNPQRLSTHNTELIVLRYRDLEKAVEDLSELLESPIEAEGIPVLRQKMTDKTVCWPFEVSHSQ
jgi:hypothetical protein